MTRFPGFPDGRLAATALPNQFFAQVLPTIDSLAELKVTLHIYWRTSLDRRKPPWLTVDAVVGDSLLRAGLVAEPGGAAGAIRDGLRRAVERGTLVAATAAFADATCRVVAPNTSTGRRALAGLLAQAGAAPAPTPPLPAEPTVTGTARSRPSIFDLYQENIGLVQPIIADELRAAAELYPADWIDDAFRRAVAYNKRNWRFIRRILERWATEGRDADAAARERTAGGARPPTRRQWTQTYQPGDGLPDV